MFVLEKKGNFLYIQIFNQFKENIENGIWEEGSQLPTEYELMKTYNVSRDTIRKSLHKLSQEGYVYRQAGKGTFVRNIKSRYKLTSLESFTEQMKNRGLVPSSELLSVTVETPSKRIKKYLELKDEEKIYKVERIRKADNEPMCYEITYITEKLCPDIDKFIDKETSLYRLYEEFYKLKLDYGDIFLEAENCTENLCKYLNIPKDSPILKMKCVVYLENKTPLYFVESFYIGEKYVFFASMPRI